MTFEHGMGPFPGHRSSYHGVAELSPMSLDSCHLCSQVVLYVPSHHGIQRTARRAATDEFNVMTYDHSGSWSDLVGLVNDRNLGADRPHC